MTTPAFKKSDHPRSAAGDRWVDKPQSPDELGQMSPESSAVDRLYARYMETGYYSEDAARSIAVEALAKAAADGVDEEFYLEYSAFRETLTSDDRYSLPSIKSLSESGYTVADVIELRELRDGKFKRDTRALLVDHGITAARAMELMDLTVPANTDALIAMNPASDVRIADWLSTVRGNEELRTWMKTWPTIGKFVEAGFSTSRTVEFAGAGIDPRSAVAGDGRFSPTEARQFATESKLKPELVGAYMLHNLENQGDLNYLVSAATAAKYGSAFTPAETAALARLDVAPKVARSLHAIDKYMPPVILQRFAAAGITTGSELRAWKSLTSPDGRMTVGSGRVTDHNTYSRENPDYVKRIIAAKKSGVSTEAATSYVAVGVTDPAQWKSLAKAGVLDARPWATALHGTGRANSLVRQDLSSTASFTEEMAKFAKAGGTAEDLANAQRAGLPVTVAREHLGQDLWAAGAPYRTQVIAAETERYESAPSWRNTPPAAWEWTEETYLGA